MEAEIDGVIYPYTKRNLPELLGGLAFFVTGLSMVESSNETTQNAVNWYNSQLKPDKISMNLQLGLNQKGHLALRLNF